MKIVCYVPTRGDVWFETAQWAATQAIDKQFYVVFHQQGAGVSAARNEIVRMFLEMDERPDILMMLDADVIPPNDGWEMVPDVIQRGEADICAAVVPIGQPGTILLPNVFRAQGNNRYSVDLSLLGLGGVQVADAVGTGMIAIHRNVLEHSGLRRPFDALRDPSGGLLLGEDINFCRRASAQGFKIAAHFDVWCEHMVTLHANELAQVYMQAMQGMLPSSQEEEVDDGEDLVDGNEAAPAGAQHEHGGIEGDPSV